MKKWNIRKSGLFENKNFAINHLIDVLLENRGITTAKEKEDFLHPDLSQVTPKNVGIKLPQLKKALSRIEKAIEKKEQIIVFGDYDVDGITGSAILWETLHEMGARAMPYIPHRVDEGYGLSKIGIANIKIQYSDVSLIITVDNGIVANEAVDFANSEGIDVIITDHHTVGSELPSAHAVVHTTNLCGSAVAYLLSQELTNMSFRAKRSGAEEPGRKDSSTSSRTGRSGVPLRMTKEDNHLELAALGTIADLVPLTYASRAIVYHGLKKLSTTNRLGLLELFSQAGINTEKIGVYEVGYIIGPRLNAAGRIESAMDSLRLLCTKDRLRASELAEKLELINRERQNLMKDAAAHAIAEFRGQTGEISKLLIIANESYQEGVIGLVAGKLVEEYYRPAIVISKKEKHSKASVRSVSGFDIIEFLRNHLEYFVNIGGHPMAAGFTIETEKIELFKDSLEKAAEEVIHDDLLKRAIKIDCELPLEVVSKELFIKIAELSPFGMGNPEPVFASRLVTVDDIRLLGKDMKHLKLSLTSGKQTIDAIGFGMGDMSKDLRRGDKLDIAYTIDLNTWNGRTTIQLKLKDIQKQ